MNIAEYRQEGSKLFKYDAERNAYVFVYRNDRLKTMKALINEYLQSDYENDVDTDD